MYLTRMYLNENRKETRELLESPERIHGMVEDSLLDYGDRNLWRLDEIKGKKYVLIASEQKPNLKIASRIYGYGSYETKSYDNFINSIETNMTFRFKLSCNPSKRDFASRKMVALKNRNEQIDYVTRKSEMNGFKIFEDSLIISNNKMEDFLKDKGQNRARIFRADYTGILIVTEKELFRKCLKNGIGKGKAFGLGMMTISS